MRKFRILAFSFLIVNLPISQIKAVSSIGTISMRVISVLSIESKVALTFPSANPGESAVKINPEDPLSAKFQVRGEPNTAFQIALPPSVELVVDGGGSEKKIIRISTFKSQPEGVGTLDSKGTLELAIGATREALHISQAPGEYIGSYTISVVY